MSVSFIPCAVFIQSTLNTYENRDQNFDCCKNWNNMAGSHKVLTHTYVI
jgi:hypothetical protein